MFVVGAVRPLRGAADPEHTVEYPPERAADHRIVDGGTPRG